MRTPHLRVDTARLQANVTRVAERAAAAGVALRPHAKTHKCAEIGRLQLEAGAIGLTVATIGEAEAFAAYGVEDLFIAYPLWLTDDAARRLRDLADTVDLAIGVDSAESAARTAGLLAGTGVVAMVEVDCGHHRSGVAPVEAGRIAAAADEARALGVAVEAFRASGLEPDVVSGGSTPSLEPSLEHRDTGATPVDVVPNHVCNAVNLADDLWTDTGERWAVVARGANS